MSQWCEMWLEGYKRHRPATVVNARDHLRWILDEFGDVLLSAIRPSMVKAWVAKLQAHGLAPSYVYAVHGRLAQVLSDAMHDGLLGRSPCSRRTSPPAGRQKPYVATTEQVWALHDAMPEHFRSAVLLGAFAGLRLGEACGLRVTDVDFMRNVVHPAQQYGGGPLKTDGLSAPIPISHNLTLMLSESVRKFGTDMMVTNGRGGGCRPAFLKMAVLAARNRADVLPEGFSFHDLRHYFASALIASGADIKTVQARMRHANASTTLDTYRHLWPDADESTRAAIGKIIAERMAQ